jgi:uncharacterized membrane protein YphA (DoxX/SURF4 family)
LGVAFIAFGLNHIVGVRDLVVIVPTFLPGGALWVYVTGAAFLAAGVSFVGDVLVRRAALLLALMFLVFITTVHLPALFQAESLAAARGAGFGVFQDLAFVGAALLLAERDHSP